MNKVIRSIVLLGFMSVGGGLLAQKAAEACTVPSLSLGGDRCACFSADRGYDTCTTNGVWCVAGGSGCGDGPGTLPV